MNPKEGQLVVQVQVRFSPEELAVLAPAGFHPAGREIVRTGTATVDTVHAALSEMTHMRDFLERQNATGTIPFAQDMITRVEAAAHVLRQASTVMAA